MIRQTSLRVLAPIVGAIIFCHGVATRAGEIPWKIDEPAAERLAAEAHHGAATHMNLFEPEDYDGGPFFVFNGLTPAPVNGSYGMFAVNRWTGDVWRLWGCHIISTPASRKSQAEIRRRFTREELKQYARLGRLKPECMLEDDSDGNDSLMSILPKVIEETSKMTHDRNAADHVK